jgi:hypothetical protein
MRNGNSNLMILFICLIILSTNYSDIKSKSRLFAGTNITAKSMGIMIRITGSPTKITDLTFVVAKDLLKSLHLT